MSDDYILIPINSTIPEGTDFCLTLDNDFMEPLIPRGERVYISRSQGPEEFEVGILPPVLRGLRREHASALRKSRPGKRKPLSEPEGTGKVPVSRQGAAEKQASHAHILLKP